MTPDAASARSLFFTDDHWAGRQEVVFGTLLFEFLLFSPSYELARKHRAGTLSTEDQKRLPTDFTAVLAVFDDLGDLREVDNEVWWQETGLKYFGYEGDRPRVGAIDVLLANRPERDNTLAARLGGYLQGDWLRQGQPPAAILTVPLHISKADAIEQFGSLLSQLHDELRVTDAEIPEPARPKYPLHGEKRDTKSLFRYLKCLVVKARAPDLKLFEIALLAELSSTYSPRFEVGDDGHGEPKFSYDARFDPSGELEDKNALKILASRALDRGMMIAENAARGVFPNYVKNSHAVSPDWSEICDRLDARLDWEEAQVGH